MSASFLRVYRGPEEETSTPTLVRDHGGKPCITAPLSEVLPLLADAVNSRRTAEPLPCARSVMTVAPLLRAAAAVSSVLLLSQTQIAASGRVCRIDAMVRPMVWASL